MSTWGNYTPGPWRIEGCDHAWGGLEIVGPNGVIAHGLLEPEDPAEFDTPDARLISKAYLIPELVVFLENVIASEAAMVALTSGRFGLGLLPEKAQALLDKVREP